MGRAIALWDLRELSRIRDAAECQCLHSPSTWIVQAGALCRCSGRPTRLLVCVDWTTLPGPLLWLWTIASMGCCPPPRARSGRTEGCQSMHALDCPTRTSDSHCMYVYTGPPSSPRPACIVGTHPDSNHFAKTQNTVCAEVASTQDCFFKIGREGYYISFIGKIQSQNWKTRICSK